MKIGLMGCEFSSPNKGCEALTYSILHIINNLDCKNKKVTIYNFSGTELGKVPQAFPELQFINVKPKLKDPTFRYIRFLSKCDVILDVTMGDSFSDIYSEELYHYLIRHKKVAEFFCKNYILLPQTYGPFHSSTSAKNAVSVFSRAKKIYCRDELSKKILEQDFDIKEVELTSDLAFMLPYDKNMYPFKRTGKKKLGINVSGLLYKGGFYSENQFSLTIDYKSYIEKVINYFLEKEEYEVHLIPHVIDLTENPHDDDFQVCKMLIDKFPTCILAPAFETPIEAKSYISNMDIFIGSRMHSTIAAFSSSVVTIPISYSRKFEGLFYSLDYKYVIDGRKETLDSAFNKTLQYVEESEKLKNKQQKSLEIIEEKKKTFINSFSYLMREINKD